MSGLLGQKNTRPEYTGLQVNTSASILPVPIVWGVNRIAGNLVYYNNFTATLQPMGPKGAGKGGGSSSAASGGGNTQYDYKVDLVLALCEGPIHGFGYIWKDRSIFGQVGNYVPIWDQSDNSVSYLWIFEGTPNQAAWGYFSTVYPGVPLAFPSTAYVAAAQYDLGNSATIGNLGFEVYGIFAGSGSNGTDADPSLVIQDFLSNPQYGAGFDGTLIDTTTLFSAGGAGGTVQDLCRAVGISFSPALTDQEQGSSILARWLQLLNVAAVWNGQALRFLPYGDQAVTAGTVVTTSISETVPNNPDDTPNGWGFGIINVDTPGTFVADLGVKYATEFYGGPLIFIGATIPLIQGTYGRIGTQYYFSVYDINVGVTITFQYTTGDGYTPNLSPVYTLADADFIDAGGDDDVLTVERVDPYALPTIQRIECLSRSNFYSSVPIEARDQSQIEVLGPRVASSISAREICDEINVGPIVAQAILQRELYVRATFKFKSSWALCLLDPMDVLGLTDSGLGLSNFLVRVVSVEEDDNGDLSFVCEELVSGISTPPKYTVASTTSIVVNQAQPAGAVNAPLIYEPPGAYSGGVIEVMLGASGSLPSGAADPNWGGAWVWASLDDISYQQLATIRGALPQGFLTAAMGAASGWDAANRIGVDLTESGGVLTSVSQQAAVLGVSLCLVDNELCAFQNATLTAPNKYTLSGLERGLYGTTGAAHVAGASFAFVASGSVITQAIPTGWIGQTVWLKFQSFNIFESGALPLAECTAYPVSTSASAILHPIATQLSTGVAVDLGSIETPATVADDFGPIAQAVSGSVNLGPISTIYPIMQQIQAALPSGTLDLGTLTGAVSTSDDWGAIASAVVNSADLNAGTPI